MLDSHEPEPREKITAELVQRIADRVYAMLQKELRQERERRRTRPVNKWHRQD